MPRFPRVIHVTREQPTNGAPYFEVHEMGVAAIDETGTVMAIYQLVEVGRVSVDRRFVAVRGRRRRRLLAVAGR